jgi:hypothetical protein
MFYSECHIDERKSQVRTLRKAFFQWHRVKWDFLHEHTRDLFYIATWSHLLKGVYWQHSYIAWTCLELLGHHYQAKMFDGNYFAKVI